MISTLIREAEGATGTHKWSTNEFREDFLIEVTLMNEISMNFVIKA